MTTTGFEYKRKKNETPFETFLRYTDEKKKSATKLAAVLKEALREDLHLLDIGTGNGEYLDLALSKINIPNNMRLTLIEPSNDLESQLEDRFEKRLPATNVKVVNATLQDFAVIEKQ